MGNETAFRIRKTALALFKERGYAHVTIDAICRTAEVPKSTFFYHFKSKNELLSEFYDYFETVTTERLPQMAAADNYWEKCWLCVEPWLERSLETGPGILSQIIVINIQTNVGALGIQNEEQLNSLFIEIIKEGQKAGVFLNKDDPKIINENIKYLMRGILFQWCVNAGKTDLRAILRESLISLLGVRKDLV